MEDVEISDGEPDFLSPDLYEDENAAEKAPLKKNTSTPVKKTTGGGKGKRGASRKRGTGCANGKGKVMESKATEKKPMNRKEKTARNAKAPAKAKTPPKSKALQKAGTSKGKKAVAEKVEKENIAPDEGTMDQEVTKSEGSKVATASRMKKRKSSGDDEKVAKERKTSPKSKPTTKQRPKKKYVEAENSNDEEQEAVTTDSDDELDELESAMNREDGKKINAIKSRSEPPKEFLTFMSGDAELSDTVVQAVESFGKYRLCGRSDANVEPQVFVIGEHPRRTGRLLYAIARGIWIVHSDWVLSSISAGSWLPYADFEAADVHPGAKLSRLAKINKEEGILSGRRVGIVGRSKMESKEIRDLIAACDGRVCETSCDIVLVCDGALEMEIKIVQAKPSSMRVNETWLYDSVEHWSLRPPSHPEILPIYG